MGIVSSVTGDAGCIFGYESASWLSEQTSEPDSRTHDMVLLPGYLFRCDELPDFLL